VRLGHHNMRALDATVSVDHAIIGGQDAGAGVVIQGDKPPLIPREWWPWIALAGLAGVIWWMTKDDAEEEGASMPRPFDG